MHPLVVYMHPLYVYASCDAGDKAACALDSNTGSVYQWTVFPDTCDNDATCDDDDDAICDDNDATCGNKSNKDNKRDDDDEEEEEEEIKRGDKGTHACRDICTSPRNGTYITETSTTSTGLAAVCSTCVYVGNV